MAKTLRSPAGRCTFAHHDTCKACDAVHTVCYMCSSECGLILHKRDGRICGVFADPAHPMNHGALCPKALAIPELVHSQDRIRTPLKRMGKRGEGDFHPISWQQALEEIAEKLVRSKKTEGPQSLLVQFGEKPDHDMMYRFANAYGTPNILDHDSLCDTNRRQGFMFTYGKSHFRPLPDLNRPLQSVDGIRHRHDCRHLLLLGENPMEATRFLFLRQGIQEAIRQGMRLTVVDPFCTATAKLAQSWLAVRPGSDLALVFAILRFLIEHDDPGMKERSYLDHPFIAQWTEGFNQLRQYLLADK
jgi:thiosulfate reductase/polysulfide reductase chain A